jgi:hypothetical protein
MMNLLYDNHIFIVQATGGNLLYTLRAQLVLHVSFDKKWWRQNKKW